MELPRVYNYQIAFSRQAHFRRGMCCFLGAVMNYRTRGGLSTIANRCAHREMNAVIVGVKSYKDEQDLARLVADRSLAKRLVSKCAPRELPIWNVENVQTHFVVPTWSIFSEVVGRKSRCGPAHCHPRQKYDESHAGSAPRELKDYSPPASADRQPFRPRQERVRRRRSAAFV
jgi:hypothetical protein